MRTDWMRNAWVVAVIVVTGAPAGAAQPTAGPPPRAVTGTFTLDGKPLALEHAVAVARPDVFDETKGAFTLAFTSRPVAVDPLPYETAGDRLSKAVTAGIVLHVGQNHYCKIVIRDPALGATELQNMGAVCDADSISVFGPDRVRGRIVSFPNGKEEEIVGHKVAYTLQFDVPVLKAPRPKLK